MSNEIIGTKRNSPPFRYDIVGSFLRTDEIKIARKQYNSGEINAEELKNVEDIEIRKLIEKEKEIGLIAVTDGEFRRSWWHLDFLLELKVQRK